MKRLIYQSLMEWSKDKARKVLLLRGARQVGKTLVAFIKLMILSKVDSPEPFEPLHVEIHPLSHQG